MPPSAPSHFPFPARTVVAVLLFGILGSVIVAQSPAIAITSVPAYGTNGVLTGTVSGVNFATHRVAVYIQIEGSGWWTKPSSNAALVPIQPSGLFSANVTTGGVDDRATIFHVALLAPGVPAPVALGTGSIPASLQSLASDTVHRFARTIQFAGRTWGVKDSPTPIGPGTNVFSSSTNSVWVDAAGRLHLTVRRVNGTWRASEVVLIESLGYGTYWFTTESEVEDLDPRLVFGAFTWDPFGDDTTIPSWPNREIDFEDSRWGSVSDPTTSQVVVQPYNVPGNLIRYTTPDLSGSKTLTRFFRWAPTEIGFAAARGLHTPCQVPPTSVLHESVFVHNPASGNVVPPAGREQFRFNLWQNAGLPSSAPTTEIIISDFRFAPSTGVFPLGSGINPRGSLLVLNGAPQLGSTLTLGVSDPTGTASPGALTLLALTTLSTPSIFNGVVLPGIGFGGVDSELLLELSPSPLFVASPSPWGGPMSPAIPYTIVLPQLQGLAGQPVYAQGALFANGSVLLTEALELCLTP